MFGKANYRPRSVGAQLAGVGGGGGKTGIHRGARGGGGARISFGGASPRVSAGSGRKAEGGGGGGRRTPPKGKNKARTEWKKYWQSSAGGNKKFAEDINRSWTNPITGERGSYGWELV